MNELLILSLGFLSLAQILKVFLDLWSTKTMIKALRARDEIHEQEWKQMIHCYGNIFEKIEELKEQIEALDIFDVVIKDAGAKKGMTRGPYGPRKKKGIEHKKTPASE